MEEWKSGRVEEWRSEKVKNSKKERLEGKKERGELKGWKNEGVCALVCRRIYLLLFLRSKERNNINCLFVFISKLHSLSMRPATHACK